MPVSLSQYLETIEDRPKKFSESDVNYVPAPEGSAIRCNCCIHFYRRSIDSFSVCEIMRSDRTDREGVFPDWRCMFYTITGDFFPLLDAEEEPHEESEEEESDIPY